MELQGRPQAGRLKPQLPKTQLRQKVSEREKERDRVREKEIEDPPYVCAVVMSSAVAVFSAPATLSWAKLSCIAPWVRLWASGPVYPLDDLQPHS